MALAAVLAFSTATPALAAGLEIAGVKLPDTRVVEGAGALRLNGAGIRKKFFVKVYVGALYLPRPGGSAEQIIDADVPRRVEMHVLYKKISAEKLRAGWSDGFVANHEAAALEPLTARLEAFNAMFGDAVAGDVLAFDMLPGKGTAVFHNGRRLGEIEGADFQSALMRVWLGDEPASGALKKGMLGGGG